MANWSSIDCSEVFGTRTEARAWIEGATASVQLDCAYENRYLLSEDLFLNGIWPFVAGLDFRPIVQNISIVPLEEECTTTGQSIDYKTARLTVNYGVDRSAGNSDQGAGAGTGRQYYTEELVPQVEVISLQEDKFYRKPVAWDLDPDPNKNKDLIKLNETNYPTFRQYTFSIIRTFYNWITVPTEFKDFKGHVNDAEVTFPSLGLTFAAEELMFVPRNAQKTVSSEGTAGYTVQVEFIERKGGWNKYVLQNEGEPEAIWYWAGDPKVLTQLISYPLSDFSGWIF